jgi:Uncharacterised nucleotidyltransferase
MQPSAPGAEAPSRAAPRPVAAWLLQTMGVEILREVTARCEAAAVPVLPVKGVVTSRLLYADIAERPITDVDVRVRPGDLATVRRIASAAGWPCLRVAQTYHNLTYGFGVLSLDVEGSVGPPGLCALEVSAMLARAERREIAPGLRVLVPEVHDHAVLLTVNAFKDKIATAPPWALVDLERIVVHPDFRREEFVSRVRGARVTTIAWIVAGWLESVRGDPAWGAIRALLESRAALRRGYARLLERRLAEGHPDSLSVRLLTRAGADTRRMQIEAVLRAAAWSVEMAVRGARSHGGGAC